MEIVHSTSSKNISSTSCSPVQNVKDFSDVAHRVKLLSQCNSFRQLISKIAAGRENFLVDLVKALKKVTDEWKNWKHQTYGKLQTRAYVSAIEQVRELYQWNRKTYKVSTPSIAASSSIPITSLGLIPPTTPMKSRRSADSLRRSTLETLHNFLITCREMENLRVAFHTRILAHLKEYLNDDGSERYVTRLELILMHWKLLLNPGTISFNHFSMGSDVLLKQAEIYDSFHCFYPVLRLIPDLCFKAEKCMELVQHCLFRDSQRGYQKEREFLLNVWLPNQNRRLNKGVAGTCSEGVGTENTAHEDLTSTIVDAQFSSQMLETLAQRLKTKKKLLGELEGHKSELDAYSNEFHRKLNASTAMVEQEHTRMRLLEERLSLKQREKQSMLQIKTTDQFSANFLEMGGDEDISKSSNLSTILDIQMLAKQRVLKEEMLEIDRRIQGCFMRAERLQNKIASKNWFVIKNTKKLTSLESQIRETATDIDRIERQHKSVTLKQKVNVTKIRCLKVDHALVIGSLKQKL